MANGEFSHAPHEELLKNSKNANGFKAGDLHAVAGEQELQMEDLQEEIKVLIETLKDTPDDTEMQKLLEKKKAELKKLIPAGTKSEFMARVETAEEVAKRHKNGQFTDKELKAKKEFEDHIAREEAERGQGTHVHNSEEFAAPVEDDEIENALGALN